MELIRINDVVDCFGISSRTLRYYEQVGILWSTHPDNKPQRYYDDAAIERLKQIIVLRKLQIPIKDILCIFNDNNMLSLTQAFVDKLEVLDGEIKALSELRQIVDDFLQKMLSRGIKKISAITLLYEETEKRLVPVGERQTVTMTRLSEISHETLRLKDVRIIRLPTMRVLSSCMKNGDAVALDMDNMQNLFAEYGLKPTPGLRNCFFIRKSNDEWVMNIKIPDDFHNTSPYLDVLIHGGTYAITSSFMEDMDETFVLLREWVNNSKDFELDLDDNGVLNRDELIEEILPWDIALKQNRFQQDVFVPVRINERSMINE
jgi:DNA-binding transcriptional MerR regulator